MTPVIGWHFKTFVYFEMEFLLIFQLHLLRGAKPSHWWNRHLILKKIVEIVFPPDFCRCATASDWLALKKIANFECRLVLQGRGLCNLVRMAFDCLFI